MKLSTRRAISLACGGALALGTGLVVALPATASGCAITDISISAPVYGDGSYAAGYGKGHCSGGSSNRLNMQVLHNYDSLPDPVIVDLANTGSGTLTQAGGRCDNHTKAQYYSKSMFTSQTPWLLTSNKVIQTCSGTRSD